MMLLAYALITVCKRRFGSWSCEVQLAAAQDLRETVQELQSGGEEVKDGMAPVYGLASVSPDRNIIGEFLVAYQDVLLSG